MTTKTKPHLFPLILLISLAAVSAVLFTPALPDISRFFNISEDKAALTISVFLIGYALGQLPYGPMADRFGRKKAIYMGLGLAIFSSAICMLSGLVHSFALLLIGRFLMAVGSSVGLKITYTIIADVFQGKEATKALAITLLSFAVAPGISVFIGGLITQYWRWEGNFLFLTLYALFLVFLTTQMVETSAEIKRDALQLKRIRKGFASALKRKEILICAGLGGAQTSITYLFATDAPYIALERIHLTPSQYGLFNLIPAAGMIIGGLSSIKLLHYLKRMTIIALGIILICLGSLAMMTAFFARWITPLTLFFPFFIITIGMSLVQPNITTIALQSAENKSYGSATLNFLNIGSSVSCILLIGFLFPGQALSLPIILVSISAVMIFLRMVLRDEN